MTETDKKYEIEVNQFIGKASKTADDVILDYRKRHNIKNPTINQKRELNELWDISFHKAMNRLTQKAGIRCIA